MDLRGTGERGIILEEKEASEGISTGESGPTIGQKHRDGGRVSTSDGLSWWPENTEMEEHI